MSDVNLSDGDLETRLRADAARREADDFASLDFDEALDLATHDDKHERTRRSALRWAAVAAAVVVVAGAAAALTWKSPKQHTQPSRPPTVTYRGHVYRDGPVPAQAALVDRRDPARLNLLVMTNTNSAKYFCFQLRPAAALVRESSTEVVVQARTYHLPLPKNGFCVPGLTRQQFTITLSRPLGTRALVNELDNSPVPVLDPTELPVPGYLPSGFVQGVVQPISLADTVVVSARTWTRGSAQLGLVIGPTEFVSTSGSPSILVTQVAGRRAEMTFDDNGRCLTWPTRPGVARQLCSTGTPVLSSADLLKVARSLP